MEKNIVTIPGSRLAEYLLVLSPPQPMRARIVRVKDEFREEFGEPGNIFGQPHITLVNFRTWEVMEERLVNRLRSIAMGYPPFKVLLKDFGSFPAHTVYVKVFNKLPVQGLVAQLRTCRKLMKSPGSEPNFCTEPHITIARRLSESQHNTAWAKYVNKRFSGSFIADAMLLLKRRPGSSGYQIVSRLELLNMPVHTTQGLLFSEGT